jgi:Tfp pilus assembly protein PilO
MFNKARFAVAMSVAVGLLSFYFFDYQPYTRRSIQLQATTIEHQNELRSNQIKASDRTKIAAGNERLRHELDQIRKPSNKQELPDLIKEITLFGQQSSLKKFDYKPGTPVQSELFCELPLALTFEGDFTNVFDFLRSAEQMQRLTRIRSMTLKAKNDRTGFVQAQVAMNIYFSAD